VATVTLTVPDGVPARFVAAVCLSETADNCAGLTQAQRNQLARRYLYRTIRDKVLSVEAGAAAQARYDDAADALNGGEGAA
jgi:hypothetical protein